MISIATAVATAAAATSAWAATDERHGSHHPAAAAAVQVAQAAASGPGAGVSAGMGGTSAMPGYGDPMKAMQDMHDKMLAAKTPEERNAMMAEQMYYGWSRPSEPGRRPRETPQQVLQRRLAGGEITPDEYEKRKALLDRDAGVQT